jgi:hypothetical protein
MSDRVLVFWVTDSEDEGADADGALGRAKVVRRSCGQLTNFEAPSARISDAAWRTDLEVDTRAEHAAEGCLRALEHRGGIGWSLLREQLQERDVTTNQ